MSNSAEQRLAQRVLEQLRRDPGNQMSSGDLYAALGGQKVLRYTENEFRAFLRTHCSFAEEQESGGDENKSPKYALHDTLRRKRTKIISKGQPINTHTPAGSSFDVKTDGYKSLLHAAKKLADYSGEGTVVWNELRKYYRKDTGRHLNVEELNLMIGTSNMTKCQILSTMFNGIFEPLDSKALTIKMDTSKPYSELLKMRNSSKSSNTSSSSSCAHKKCESLRASAGDTFVPMKSVKTESASSEGNYDSARKSTTVDTVSVPATSVSVKREPEVGDDEVFATEEMNILNTQTHFENDEETVHKFAESLIQHRNSLPDEFGDEIYGTKISGENLLKVEEIEPDLSAVKSELELTGLTNEQSSSSNGMNAAFLADDSIRTSFCTPMDGSFETSGERGYLSCSEQLSDAAADVSLNISTTESVDPPTPRRTHEITLCSSRNGIATVLPQPDISPLCSANHLLDSPSMFAENEHSNSVTPESAVEEPVPLPRKIVSAPLDSSNESIEAEVVKKEILDDIVDSKDIQQEVQSESFVEDPAPTERSTIEKTEEVSTQICEPVLVDSEKVTQNFAVAASEISDPVVVESSVVSERLVESVAELEPAVEEPVDVSVKIEEEVTEPKVDIVEKLQDSLPESEDVPAEAVVAEVVQVPEPVVPEAVEVVDPVIIAASPAKPARSIPSITIQLEEETEKLLLQTKEMNAITSDIAFGQTEEEASQEVEEKSVEVVFEKSEENDVAVQSEAVTEELDDNIPSSTSNKAEEAQKPEQDVHSETFVEEISILIDQNPKDIEASCTFIEDEPISETSVSPADVDGVFENPEALQESDDDMSLLTQKSESTITVIQQPLTSNNTQVGPEQEGSDSDSIPYDNDESSNSSSPAKTVTVEVELNSSSAAQIPSSSVISEEDVQKSAEVALKREIPECIPEDEMKSPIDDEPSRDPSIVSEQVATTTEDQDTNPDNIQCLSPEAEMPEEGVLVQKPDVNEKDSRRKNKKRARMVAPRRRIFNCCTVL
ncbi:unnamed protein product [Auanema sp. JU1783]|nr:unnamed protein product [Auanema sp. JU1783]